jgi:DNA-binding response OmpR family regulator
MPVQFRILVIEDDPEMREMLKMILAAEGFDVVLARDAMTGLRAAYQTHPDAILLDVMMPNMDGFEACRRLREMTDVPVIFVTGRATEMDDVVKGFSLGADDYLTKPFNRSELISRLNARLRRTSERVDNDIEYISPTASVILNSSRHELVIGERSIYLGPKEFEVVRLLIRHAGKVLSRDAILAQVWGSDRVGEPDLVKQYIYRLRKKIEEEPNNPRYVHSVRGEGYYFDAAELL